MKIPDEKIQEVRESTHIIDVVSQYVSLKQRGKSFVGLCPFHQEKTPSFTVDPARGFYHCFGCGAGGDAFSFVMKMEKIGFLEAVKSLAERAGIPLPSYDQDDRQSQEIELLYRVNRMASDYYQSCLRNAETGESARQYILKREFESKTLETFQIGYAPDQWDGLLKKAEQSNIKAEVLFRAGLAVPRKDGRGYYDRFRGRLMFPIVNLAGKVVGFGGRILGQADGVPKYINTSETPIYQKGQILYGLFQSKTGIRRQNRALLVEGYTDMMRLYQSGFDYAVASSGTALTEGQAKLLSQSTESVVLVFDGDSAGLKAALRGIDIILSAGLHVEVAALPKGMDPDLFLLKQGSEAMRLCIEGAFSFVDFQIKQMQTQSGKSAKIPFQSAHEKVAAARNLLLSIQKIRDPMERQLVVKDLAEKLGVDEALLHREIRQNIHPQEISAPVEARIPSRRREKAEKGLVVFLLSWIEPYPDKIFRHINSDFFQNSGYRRLFMEICDIHSRGLRPDSDLLSSRFVQDPQMTAFLSRFFSEENEAGSNSTQFGLDCVLCLVDEKYQEEIKAIRERIKKEQARGTGAATQEWFQAKKTLENLKVEIVSEWKKGVEIE